MGVVSPAGIPARTHDTLRKKNISINPHSLATDGRPSVTCVSLPPFLGGNDPAGRRSVGVSLVPRDTPHPDWTGFARLDGLRPSLRRFIKNKLD